MTIVPAEQKPDGPGKLSFPKEKADYSLATQKVAVAVAVADAESDNSPPLTASVPLERPRVLSIQILRGFAACFVVLYHTDIILGQRSYPTGSPFKSFAQWGWLGVNLFFVISGFTIFLAHHKDIGLPFRLGRYVWRRFVRIYPIYWLLLAGFVIATQLKIEYRELDFRPGNLLSTIALIPFVQDPELPLKVAWTMLFEVMFYVLFAFAILNRQLSRVIWPAWTVAILLSTFVWERYALDPLNIYNIYFIAGGLMWWLSLRMRGSWALPIALVLLISIVPAAIFATHRSNVIHDNLALGLLALPMSLALALCVATERVHPSVFLNKPLLLIGDASYSIYLVHSAFLSMARKFQPEVLNWVPSLFYFCFAIVAAVSIGVAVHLFLERPMLKYLRNRFSSRPAPAVIHR